MKLIPPSAITYMQHNRRELTPRVKRLFLLALTVWRARC